MRPCMRRNTTQESRSKAGPPDIKSRRCVITDALPTARDPAFYLVACQSSPTCQYLSWVSPSLFPRHWKFAIECRLTLTGLHMN